VTRRSPLRTRLPLVPAPRDERLLLEVALARHLAVDDLRALFELSLGLRSVHAIATNTRHAYAADWASFVASCREYGFCAAPASPAAVETFIEFRSPAHADDVPAAERVRFHKYVALEDACAALGAWSLRRPLAAIGAVHRWLSYPDPTRDQNVKVTFKINVAGHQRQGQKDRCPGR
jgi:hypothetical protein